MKIRSNIELQDDRYRVQIDTLGFTALEEEQMLAYGEPLVDIGSNFSEAVTRPSQVNTAVVITPVSGGTGATAVAVISASNTILSVTVTAGGTGYANGANISFTGDGSGATATATIVSGVITSIVVTAPGTNYHAVPYTCAFTLLAAPRRIRTDFPVVQVFDLNDFPDADARAKVFADTIVSRLTTAKATLLAQTTPFQGESLVTV